MSYSVLADFYDLQDKNHHYRAGDHYPRPEYAPTAARVAELAGNSNRQGKPLILPVAPRKTRGRKGDGID